MPNPFLNPGEGTPLRKVSGATGNTLEAPDNTTIPAGGYTELVAAHEGLNMNFLLVFAAAATGSVDIQRCPTTAAAASDTVDSNSVSAVNSFPWSAGEPLTGYHRVYNNTDQNATVYYNNVKHV